MDNALVIEGKSGLLNCQIFLLYAGGGGIKILILQNIIWCLHVGSREDLTPLLSTRLGWPVTIRSIQDNVHENA